MDKKSTDYHDYIFKDGSVLGLFDEMYTHSNETPWHQDKAATRVLIDIDLAILRHFLPRENTYSICDLGCGLGYVTNRIYSEFQEIFSDLKVTGIDISKIAAKKAKDLHSNINFYHLDILKDDISILTTKFDLVYVKDVIWYISNDAEIFFDKATKLLNKNGLIYVMQSVPDKPKFVGSDLFPTTLSIAEFLQNKFNPIYISSTYEFNCVNPLGHPSKDKYLRFFGSKK